MIWNPAEVCLTETLGPNPHISWLSSLYRLSDTQTYADLLSHKHPHHHAPSRPIALHQRIIPIAPHWASVSSVIAGSNCCMIPLLMLETVLRMEKGKVLEEADLYCFPILTLITLHLHGVWCRTELQSWHHPQVWSWWEECLSVCRFNTTSLHTLSYQINWWREARAGPTSLLFFPFLTTLFPRQRFLSLSEGEHRNKLSFKSCLMPYYLDLCFLNLRTVVSLWDGLLWIIPSWVKCLPRG